MIPSRFKLVMNYLTRAKKAKPDLPEVFRASQADVPPKKESLETMEAINEFVLRNPRQEKAGGGMLVQPGFDGVRQGYSGRKLTDLKNYGERGAKKITIYGKDYRLNTKGPNKGKVSFQTTKKGKDITLYLTPKQLKDRLDTPRETGFVTGQQTKLAKKIDRNLNNWSKNWVKNNIKNYGVRDFKNFTKDMANAWSKELKDNPNKYPSKFGVGTRLTNDFGLPVVRGGFQIEGITFPQRPDRPGFNPELTWQKLFIKNKLKDKDFKEKVNSYLDWNLSKKVEGGAGSMTKTAALDYGKFKKGFDEDVVYLMGEVLNNRALNPGGGQVGINDIFKEVFGKKGDAYFKKYQGSWGRWRNNFDAVAKLAGLNQSETNSLLQKQINDSKKIMELYNVKNLPPEFVVAQDHLFGLAEAKELGDPKIARQTLKALVATTKEQNRILGQGGFSNKRIKLIRKFKNALPEEKINIINQLNTLSQEYVPDRIKYSLTKDDALRITNLQPEKTLKSKAEAYEKLTKTFPKIIQNQLLKNTISYSKKPECKVNLKADGGRIGFANSIDCIQDGLKEQKLAAQKGNKKAAQELIEISKVAARGSLLKNVLGPGALLGEAVYEGAVIGNKVLGGTPADIAYAESYLSYLDPRKYRGELDPTTLKREDMLTREIEDEEGNVIKKITAPGNIPALKSGFAAQDQISAFEKAIEERNRAARGGENIMYAPAAAEAREQGARVNQSANIISSDSFKDASKIAQEFIQGQTGKQMADIGVAAVPQSVMADETRRLQAMREMKNLYPQYSDEDIIQIIKDSNLDPKDYDYTLTPKTVEGKPLFPAAMGVKPITGFDAVRDFLRQQDQMQAIADARGVANLAGGGIAKLAGVDSGPPPSSGPNSQGLQGLMKRVKRI